MSKVGLEFRESKNVCDRYAQGENRGGRLSSGSFTEAVSSQHFCCDFLILETGMDCVKACLIVYDRNGARHEFG